MRKKLKREKENKRSFNAYQYANDFEKLSLDIVKIIDKSSFDESNIECSDTTQQTRDYGVDAYLVLNIHGKRSTYTIEAKLRTSDSLSLRDFATSILYYLINTSSKHFVVTNISYSAKTIKYIEQLNLSSEKFVELIDGMLLQKTINKQLHVFHHYPKELINYILEREFDSRAPIAQPLMGGERKQTDNYIPLPCYEEWMKKVKVQLDAGYNFFLVTGMSGTGKSSWIDACLNELCSGYRKHKIDLSIIQTPRLFILELLHLLLGFKIEKLIGELSKEEPFHDDILEAFQTFPGNTGIIVEAIRLLFKNEKTDCYLYVYLMKILVNHLHENFLIHTHMVFILENLHEASPEMIQFTIDMMYCIGKKNILIFWELLQPQNTMQLKNISLEQWNGFLQLLGERHYGTEALPYIVRLKSLSEPNVRTAICKYMPGISFTEEFFQAFMESFGTNARNVFVALRIIRQQKMYSAAALPILPINYPFLIENQIKELLESSNAYRDFYRYAFHFLLLLEGSLDPIVTSFLDETFSVNAGYLLLNSGLFYKKGDSLVFQYRNMEDIIAEFINHKLQIECASWLLKHLDELDINCLLQKFYEAKFLSIVSAPNAIEKINEAIQFLYFNQAYKYTIPLSEIRWQYYEKNGESLLSYQYYVKYASYLKKMWKDKGLLDETIARAVSKKDMLSIRFSNHPQYIMSNLELAFLQYQVAKGNYDYKTCEERIQYILSYELSYKNTLENPELFILAHIYSALNKKEQGKRKAFILELVNNFRTYQDNVDVKITYYVNMAAMYKFCRIDISIKLMQTARKLTFDAKKGHGDLEVEMNLLHFLCHEKNTKNMLAQICFIREMTEKENSIYNLAKTYNLEAYYYISNGLLPAQTEATIECLKSAVFHSIISGQSKQAFLFRLNLVQFLIASGSEYTEELSGAIQWFNDNLIVIERLQRNPYKKSDHMFSAFVSLLFALKKKNMVSLIKKGSKIQEFLEKYEKMEESQLLALLPDYYTISITMKKMQKLVFILF